jgi:hypothetical protein
MNWAKKFQETSEASFGADTTINIAPTPKQEPHLVFGLLWLVGLTAAGMVVAHKIKGNT